MAKEMKTINIANVPELLRLAEEVHESRERRVLRRDGENLAVLVPMTGKKRKIRRTTSAADLEAFRSAAGSWKGADTDRFIEDTYSSRRSSSRPSVEL